MVSGKQSAREEVQQEVTRSNPPGQTPQPTQCSQACLTYGPVGGLSDEVSVIKPSHLPESLNPIG